MFRLDRLHMDPATVPDGLGDVQVGDHVHFAEERQRYTVRAISTNRRWMICTKPFNLQRTVIYCVVDRVEQRRGPDDLVFSFGYETDEEIADALDGFENRGREVSVRRDVRLNVVAVNGRRLDPTGWQAVMRHKESPITTTAGRDR